MTRRYVSNVTMDELRAVIAAKTRAHERRSGHGRRPPQVKQTSYQHDSLLVTRTTIRSPLLCEALSRPGEYPASAGGGGGVVRARKSSIEGTEQKDRVVVHPSPVRNEVRVTRHRRANVHRNLSPPTARTAVASSSRR